jgi:hypothetical protein
MEAGQTQHFAAQLVTQLGTGNMQRCTAGFAQSSGMGNDYLTFSNYAMQPCNGS